MPTQFQQIRTSTSGAPIVAQNQDDTLLWDTVARAWYTGPGGGAGAVSSVFGRVGAVVAATGDYDGDQIDNVSTVAGATISDALETLALSAGAVASVFGRSGVVVAQANDYAASQVNNDSSVTGATVKAALNALLGAIPAIPVSSVFGRVGAVVAALNDYAASLVSNNSTVVGATVKDALNTIDTFLDALAASQVANDSTVSGATVKAALETLAATGGAVSSVFARTGAIVAAANDYAASQVSNDSSVTGATVKAALNALLGAIPSIPVSSVFGRLGAVVAAANDYAASQVSNDSSVSGATVKDALQNVAANQGFQAPATSSGATPAINFATNRYNVWTLSANGTPTFTMPVGYECYLELVQSGAGAFTVTWPANVDWTDALPPILTTTTGKRDLLKFVSNGTRLRGFAVLMDF